MGSVRMPNVDMWGRRGQAALTGARGALEVRVGALGGDPIPHG